jgi:anti-sigma B factor antagonist
MTTRSSAYSRAGKVSIRRDEGVMNIEQRTVGDVMVLSIRGDITMNGTGVTELADKVRSELQQGHEHLLLDLGRVRYVDSAGLGELVHALSAVPKRLNDLLIVTRLLTVFECFDEEGEALTSFDAQRASS